MNKKLEIIWAIICSSSSTDKETNNISLFNVIEQLNAIVTPIQAQEAKTKGAFIAHPFDLVIFLRSDSPIVDFTGKIEIADPSGKKILTSPFNSPNIEAQKKRYRLTLHFDGMKMYGLPGYYNFNVSIDGKKVCSVPVEINIVEKK